MDFVPAKAEHAPQTVAELAEWMRAQCCNFTGYGIGRSAAAEGYNIGAEAGGFAWCFTERGAREVVQRFASEAEAAGFGYRQLLADSTAWNHMVGFLPTQAGAAQMEAMLRERGVEAYWDKIPYGGPADPRFRVFVYGCDVHRAWELVAGAV